MAQDEPLRSSLPLTTGDVFSYAIPGGALLATSLLFDLWVRRVDASAHVPVLTSLKIIYGAVASPPDVLISALFAITVVAAAYGIGHLVASFGSLFIERVFVQKGVGYPYSLLLKLRDEADDWRKTSRSFYRGFFFWANSWLAALYIVLAFARTSRVGWVGIVVGLLVLLFAITFKLVQSDVARARRLAGRDATGILTARRRVAYALSRPWDFILNPLVRTIGTKAPLAEKCRDEFKRLFKSKFRVECAEAESQNFWYCYIY